MKSLTKYLILILLCLSSFSSEELVAQDNTQREEVQRYFGYEILPYRYLSLPYDVSVNANERGTFVDISCVYFMFLPLFLIAYLLRWKLLAGLFFLGNLFIWIIGTSNSYVFSQKKRGITNTGDNVIDYLLGNIEFMAEKTAHITAYLYYVSSFVYKPLLAVVEPISGDSDIITYPLLIIAFLAGTFLLNKILAGKSIVIKAPVIVYWVFLFFWFKFSAGIPWYGFFVFFMSIMMIMMLMERGIPSYKYFNGFIKYAFYTLCSFYIIYAIAFRISDVNSGLNSKQLGTTMLSPHFFNYQLGRQNEDQILNAFYPAFNKALVRINNDPSSLILRIGTSFSYFIENNSNRIKMDNQLGFFNAMNQTYKQDRNVITDALLASNIRYIIIDVNTPFIDKTPEQTLKKKYDDLMYYVKDNRRLTLLCTNRAFQEKNPATGKLERVFKMFRDQSKQGRIVYGGQYAIYEITS